MFNCWNIALINKEIMFNYWKKEMICGGYIEISERSID